MTYDNFKANILDAVSSRIPSTATAVIFPITKNNGQIYDVLTIKDDCVNISPSIYLDHYYNDIKKGISFEDVLDSIVSTYANVRPTENIDISYLADYENVRKHLFIKLVNKELNKELLKDTPYIEYLDLAIIFSYFFDKKFCGTSASFTIKNNHLSMWNVSLETLYQDALKNTPAIMGRTRMNFNDIIDMIKPSNDEFNLSYFYCDLPVLVLSNKHQLYGASVLCDIEELDLIANEMGCDLVIIPSSVHEVIVFPECEDFDTSQLSSLIASVNDSELSREDILSYHGYRYNRISKKVEY